MQIRDFFSVRRVKAVASRRWMACCNVPAESHGPQLLPVAVIQNHRLCVEAENRKQGCRVLRQRRKNRGAQILYRGGRKVASGNGRSVVDPSQRLADGVLGNGPGTCPRRLEVTASQKASVAATCASTWPQESTCQAGTLPSCWLHRRHARRGNILYSRSAWRIAWFITARPRPSVEKKYSTSRVPSSGRSVQCTALRICGMGARAVGTQVTRRANSVEHREGRQACGQAYTRASHTDKQPGGRANGVERRAARRAGRRAGRQTWLSVVEEGGLEDTWTGRQQAGGRGGVARWPTAVRKPASLSQPRQTLQESQLPPQLPNCPAAR
eukprot:366282-Chlamydomonas_euryale.AAC.11